MNFDDGDGKHAASAPPADQQEQAPQEDSMAAQPESAADASEGARRSNTTKATGGEGEGTEYMPDASSKSENAPPPPPRRRQPQPNPYSALGDALDYWHRQLQLVEREVEQDANEADASAKEEAAAPTEQKRGAEEPPKDEPPPGGEGGEFELAADDEAADSQVLADASKEQLDAMAQARQAKQEEEAKKRAGDDAAEDATMAAAAGEDEGEEGAAPPAEEEEAEGAQADDAGQPKSEPPPPNEQQEAPKRSTAEELLQGPPKKRAANRPEEPEAAEEAVDPNAAGSAEAEDGVSWADASRGEGREEGGEGGGGHVGEMRTYDPRAALDPNAPPGAETGEGSLGVHDDDEANEAASADLERMNEELEARLAEWQLKGAESGAAEDAWRALEGRTSSLSQELCEQLRLILEATVASKLEGDYRTGKRISMRKVIPYIASGFRKDKIWLRRTKPSKRKYQILLCIDDSESMAETGAGGLACEALALMTQALTTIEAGQLGVLKFAESVELLHPFDRPFTAEAGAHMLSRFTFRQKNTHMESLLQSVVSTLRVAREQQSASSSSEQLQLVLIVSDGRRSPAWGDPSSWVRIAAQEHILLCFVVIDSAAQKDSILDLQQVSYPNGKLTISRWIDQFPFPFYLVVRELKALPQVLSDALRQWFEMLKE